MSNTIEQLELEISANSKSAVEGIDALTQSLEKLKGATKGGLGLSKVAKETGKLNESLGKLSNVNNKASGSFTDLYHKMELGVNVIKRVANGLATVIDKSNDYVENLNLFTVSMGAYSDEASSYAETISDAMGIDTSEWIRAQGVFMTMATGFGVASDRAATMSKNLTQLGYDLASFYNIYIETAMLKLKSGLAGELEPLRAIGYDLSQAKLEATAAALGITKSVSAMTQAEKAQLRYYAIMTQVTVAQGDMARTLDDPANQLRVLKSQLSMAAREIGNVFIPALNAILPYAIALVKVIGELASGLASIFGYELPEVDYSGVEAMSGVAEETGDALDDATDSAKKLKNYMMGFDELNVLNPNSDTLDSSLGEFQFELPEYNFTSGLVASEVDKIVGEIQGALDEIEMIASGALLGLGAVLTFTGANVPLGVMLMAGGAYSLATQVALNWGSMEDPVRTTLGVLEGIVGAGLLALGAVIGLTGANAPLGIALFAAGAVSLVSAVALNWESMSGPVSTALGTITGIAGASLLALGGIIAFSGANVPLGIALMIGGAVSLATAATLNWESLTESVGACITTIGTIVGGAALVVGAVLAFTGANVPLGIGLMAVGALTMGTALALNWEAMSEEVRGVIATITSIVSVALLGVGAILAFSGTNIPLGMALMVGGAVALGTAIAPNWNTLSESVQATISTVMAIVGAGLLGVGALFAFSGANIPLGIGLMLAGATSLGTAIELNWNAITEALQGPVGGITALVGGAVLALGAVLAFTGANIPLGIALMVTGAAALATVVALNWNTLLDSLQGPVAGIVALVGGAALALGAVLAFTGAATALGIGLMIGGAASLATVATLNWNALLDALQGPVGGVTALVSTAVLALGAVLAFTGAALPLGIALMVAGAAGLVTTATLNWSTITDALQGPVGGITALVGGALLALGAVLAFTGAGLPLGIALMVAGAASLGTVAALNWNTILDALEGPVGGIVALVGGALLAVGAILAFTGVGIPLGIGLMLAGAASLGTVAALNWDTITEAMRGPVGGIVALLSGALLVLGAILLFTGAGTGLGIGLMIAGAAGLGTTVAFNWNFLLDKIKEVWNGIKNFWNSKIKPIFTAQWWLDLAKKCGNGLIGGFEAAINGIIGMFENMINWVIGGLNKISFTMPDWLGGATFGINISPVSFGRVSIPRLAEGGFPEEGQMFIAREAGPEMVGNIGRRTAVVNNEQIVASIAGGVAEANEEQTLLLREQNSLLRALLEKETGVYLDGKNLTDSVEKYQRERGRVLITGGVM